MRRSIPILILSILLGHLLSPADAALPPLVSPLTPLGEGLSTPTRLAIDRSGILYVADPRQGGVVRLTLDGRPAPGERIIRTDSPPMGVAHAINDDLLVTQGSSVAVFRKGGDGTFSKIAIFAPPDGFGTANGVTVATDGQVFVVDSSKHRVARFSPSYEYLSTFGSRGSSAGEFNLPTVIAYDRGGNQILVLDTLNGRIQFFDTSGTFIRSIGRRGPDLNGSDDTTDPSLFFTSPQGIALEYGKGTPERLERIYVVDTYQSRVQVVDPTGSGSRLRYIGAYGSTAGKLIYPADVLFDPYNSRIIVANGRGDLVPFGIDGGVSPPVDTPPLLSFSPPPSLIRESSFTLSGSVDRPAIVEAAITVGSGTVAPVTFSSITSWSTTISGLSEGVPATVTITARTVWGNRTTQTFTVTYLPNAPLLTITPLPSAVTVAESITIEGTRGSGSTITITGPAGGTTIPPGETTWRAVVGGLAAGKNDITVTASENNLDTRAQISITRASLTLFTLPESAQSQTPLQTISGTIDGVTEVEVALNGGAPLTVPVTDGFFSTALLLSRGENRVTVTARDPGGGMTSQSVTLTHDPSLPPLSITHLTGGGVSYGIGGSVPTATEAVISGSFGDGTVTVTLDGTPVDVSTQGGSWSATIPSLPTGSHTILVTLSDSRGKTSSLIFPFRVVDPVTTPPLSLTVTPEGMPAKQSVSHVTTNRNRLTIEGVTSPASAVSVDVTLDGTSLPVELERSTGRFTVSLPVELPTTGYHTLVATVYGVNGQTTTLTRTIIYQTDRPALTPQRTGSQITYTLGSGYIEATWVDPNGTLQRLPISPEGTVTIPAGGAEEKSITFTDVAGNTSRNGRFTPGQGEPTIMDVLQAIRVAVGLDRATSDQLLTGDVAPLVNGRPMPDGIIDARDVLAILYRVIGTFVW